MTPEALSKIAAEANLAPSAHNTQPVQWHMDGRDALILSLDPARGLPVGDPTGRDARLSGGAALLGTEFALARQGLQAHGIEIDGDSARIALRETACGTPPATALLAQRTCYRAGFAPANATQKSALQAALGDRDDAKLLTEPRDIAHLSQLNDSASLTFMRNAPFRIELLSWMRLSPRHANWARDGLSAEALAMGRVEAMAAGLVLRRPIFDALAAVGLGRALTAEDARTRTATALVPFFRPAEEDRWTSGRAFYALWLKLTEAGFAAWPMAVLADDTDARAAVMARAQIPDTQALITVLRVGPHPGAAQAVKARLPGKELLKGA